LLVGFLSHFFGEKLKDLFKKILLSLITCIFIITILEVFLRVQEKRSVKQENVPRARKIHDFFYYDEFGCFRIVPSIMGLHKSFDGKDQPVLVGINSAGIRGAELKKEAGFRIAFLGDSITFDGGVKWENTFTALIEEKFRKSHISENIECLNFGTSDAGIKQYFLKLKHHVLMLKPDAVVVCFYLNDSRPPQGFLGEDEKDSFDKFLESSILYELIVIRKLHYRIRLMKYVRDPLLKKRFRWGKRFYSKKYINDIDEWKKMVKEAEFDWGAGWKKETWAVVEKYLIMMKELCEKNGIKLLMACFPVSPQVEIEYNTKDLDYPQRRLESLAKQLEIPFYDLLPIMKENKNKALLCDQCHLTTSGNMVVGDALFNWLNEELH